MDGPSPSTSNRISPVFPILPTKMKKDKGKLLDVEDDEQRQNRLGDLLTRLNNSSSTLVAPNPTVNTGRQCPPGPTEPPTKLLERIKAFLPAISASNETLSRMRPEDIDIENVQEDEEQYIELNLGLGVFEAKPRTSRSRSPSSDEGSSADSSSESDSDSEYSRSSSEEGYSSSDDDSDSESGRSIDMMPIFSRPVKPLPRRMLGKTKRA